MTGAPAAPAATAAIHVPAAYAVSAYARGLERPTAFAWSPGGKLYATQENGKVVVVRPGKAPQVAARGFDVPLGLAFVDKTLYVSAQGALWRVSGGTKRAVVRGLPFGRHQQDNVVYTNGRLYFGSGSTCDACRERSRFSATVLSVDPRGTGLRVEARGLRNPYGLTVAPDGRIYVTVNGQDNLGDGEPAESVVVLRSGANYGWPTCWASFHRHRLSGSCTGVTKPLAYLEPHSSADGIAYWRSALYVTEWGQYLSRAHGRKVVRVGLDGRTSVFATGFVHPLAIAQRDEGLYVGDYSTGVVYRIALKARS
jgi:glucose/arabinose dehydrogenase